MNRRLLMLCAVLCSCGGAVGRAALTETPAGPDDASTSNADADACFAAHEQILSDVGAIARAHQTGCSVDDDCAPLDLTLSCQENCSMAVLKAQLSAAKDELAAYAVRVCPEAPTSCGIEPSCVPPTAACVDGTCRPAF